MRVPRKKISDEALDRLLLEFRESLPNEPEYNEDLTKRIVARVSAYAQIKRNPEVAISRLTETLKEDLLDYSNDTAELNVQEIVRTAEALRNREKPWRVQVPAFRQWISEPTLIDYFFERCLVFSRYAGVCGVAMVLFALNLSIVPASVDSDTLEASILGTLL